MIINVLLSISFLVHYGNKTSLHSDITDLMADNATELVLVRSCSTEDTCQSTPSVRNTCSLEYRNVVSRP